MENGLPRLCLTKEKYSIEKFYPLQSVSLCEDGICCVIRKDEKDEFLNAFLRGEISCLFGVESQLFEFSSKVKGTVSENITISDVDEEISGFSIKLTLEK